MFIIIDLYSTLSYINGIFQYKILVGTVVSLVKSDSLHSILYMWYRFCTIATSVSLSVSKDLVISRRTFDITRCLLN